MEQMIKIYEDLIEHGCDEQAETIYEMITDTIEDIESADRIEFLKKLVEKNDTFGFLNEFLNWAPYYLESNYLIWDGDYPEATLALAKIFGKGFRYMTEQLGEMYDEYCENCEKEEEDDEDILCFESWIENFYEDVAHDVSFDAWKEFVVDKDFKELYLSTIKLLEDLGVNGRIYLLERILKIF